MSKQEQHQRGYRSPINTPYPSIVLLIWNAAEDFIKNSSSFNFLITTKWPIEVERVDHGHFESH